MRLLRAAFAFLVAGAVLASGAVLATGCASSRDVRLVAASATIEGAGGPLPVRWIGALAFADVSIDGRPPRPFLVDTGASVMIVSSRAADELGLPRVRLSGDAGGIPLSAAQGLTAAAHEVSPLGEVRSGPLVLRRIDALILETSLLDAAMGARVEGVLPAAAFSGSLVTFDFAAHTVTVATGEIPAGLPDVLPLVPHTLPTITLDIAGASVQVLLDTGSDEFLSIPASAAASTAFRSPAVETGRFATAGGMAARHEGRLAATIALGPHRLADPVVSLQPTDRGGIGVDLMQHFRVTFDLAHDRVRFERTATDAIRSPPVRGLGAGLSRGEGSPTVAYVLDGSPAARAGIRTGDRIETIEGVPAAQVGRTLTEVLIATSSALRLGVADSATGVLREVTVPVATFVE